MRHHLFKMFRETSEDTAFSFQELGRLKANTVKGSKEGYGTHVRGHFCEVLDW